MIRISGLIKKFGEFVAIDHLSLEIMQGETFAFLGPNGSGKTTTLKCILGLTAPDQGDIRVQGLHIHEDAREVRRRISYLPQRVSFHDNLTAREVLSFYCRLRRIPAGRIEEVLAGTRFNFNGFADKPVSSLSGGMIQRLGLAVACLPDAPVLILDEPMVNLDPEGAIYFREFLSSLKRQGKTVVFSSHILADVELLADRVAILVGGQLVALESIESLREGVLQSSKMRLTLSSHDPRWVVTARAAGAEDVSTEGNTLVITSPPENRLQILHALESAGGRILRFATQEPSLEDIYLRYTNEPRQQATGKD